MCVEDYRRGPSMGGSRWASVCICSDSTGLPRKTPTAAATKEKLVGAGSGQWGAAWQVHGIPAELPWALSVGLLPPGLLPRKSAVLPRAAPWVSTRSPSRARPAQPSLREMRQIPGVQQGEEWTQRGTVSGRGLAGGSEEPNHHWTVSQETPSLLVLALQPHDL